ncbi:hypothetical protein F0U61_15515 [Archangium violaceum]|uniref:hypothetical protein n=1 Tax=Archangium violaceum TaxID=83451 RepID=UPI002B2BFBCF|nr:hypothetical protein F0U61_15515 [Archangium violaceum]
MVALLEDVLPWLIAFFILDAVVQLRRGQVVFARTGFEQYKLLNSGLHLAGALPFGAALIAYELPFLPTREGVWVFDPDARHAPPVILADAVSFIPWASLGTVQAEAMAVKGGSRVLFRARSPRAARALAAELAVLQGVAEGAREAEIKRWLEARCDVEAARARWKRVRLPAFFAATFGTVEALVLFGAVPALAFLPGADVLGWERVFSLLALSHLYAITGAAWALARSGASAGDVTSALGTLLIFPPYAARAGIHALRDVLASFEPLAVAAVVLPRADFLRYARRELVRTDESREATRHLGLAPFWDARRNALKRLLVAAGTSEREVLAPPHSQEVAAWCPLCVTEYRAGFAKCSDCGVELVLHRPV